MFPRRVTARLVMVVLWAAGCGNRQPAREPPKTLPVNVFADTGRTVPLRITTPPSPQAQAEAWLTRVSPARATLEPPAAGTESDSLIAPPSTPAASPAPRSSEALKPPIPRERGPLAAPSGARGSVELDVRVDEHGRVTDTRFAGGSTEPALVRAAIDCAASMRFYPALLNGQPVTVWCRERFDFGER